MPTASTASATAPPSPSASPSETVDEDALVADAIAALTEYLALANEVENNGGEGWEELKPWWGSEAAIDGGTTHFEALLASGLYTAGSTRIAEVIDSGLDPELGVVSLRYCLDGTDVQVFDRTGALYSDSPPYAFLANAQLTKVGDDAWVILTNRTSPDEPC